MTERLRPLEGKRVCWDFDGPVHSYRSGWNGPVPTDPPEPGSREEIEWYVEQGAEVVIFTTRAETREGYEGVIVWLNDNGYPPGLVVTNVKVPAIAYIDDRAVAYVPGSAQWVAVREAVVALALRGHGSARQ